jgi:hypothetical protein
MAASTADRTILTKALLASVFLTTLVGCSNLTGDCADQVTQESQSPDGRWAATSYVRDCGATTSYATHIIVRDAATPFRAWRHGGPPDQGLVYVQEQRPLVDLRWTGPHDLVIHLAADSGRVHKRLSSWHNISIAYLN